MALLATLAWALTGKASPPWARAALEDEDASAGDDLGLSDEGRPVI